MRNFATDAYKSVDDHPYGGGVGMILRVDVVDRAIQQTKLKVKSKKLKVILLDPQGAVYTQQKAAALASCIDHLILICGHYEGVDERIRTLVDEELSIGDYVLTGGEIAAMVLVDSITRLIPGVLKAQATHDESFSNNLLEYPQYTRPQTYKEQSVPEVLRCGNHKQIAQWRLDEARKKTARRRPDIIRAKKD